MHAISPYSLRIYNPHSAEKKLEDRYSKLDKVGGHDGFDVLKKYVEGLNEDFVIVEASKQVYRFKGMVVKPAKRQVTGWFEVGSYGVKNDIIDINTGLVDYKKTQEKAEIIRHYIRFFMPVGFNEGIALLHSYKGGGIKTLLHDLLRVHFQKVTGLNLQMNPLAYKKAFLAWEEASAKELKLTKFEGMDDLTDQLRRLGHKEQQLIIKPPSRSSLGKFKEYLDPNSEQYSVVEFMSTMCAQVKVVVELNGKRRTFAIGRPADEQVCEIVFDESDMDFVAGNPVASALNKWCTKVLQDLVDGVYPRMGVKV